MIKMRPYVPSSRIAVRDSIDDELSDDIDDDVFIKDSRTAKFNEEKGLKRPLMAPRRKNGRIQLSVPIMKKHRRCWRCCEPFCYALAALTTLIALISLAALILTLFPIPIQRWLKHDASISKLQSHGSFTNADNKEYVPCTQITVQKLWTKIFPRINSESPVRKADLNGDGIKEIIFGFGVDDNIQYEAYHLPKCKSPQQGEEVPCEGGVIAVNGANGELLWQTWNVGNVFSLLCTVDINLDGYTDCVAAGRFGMIFALNGRNGNSIWEFREIEVETNSPIVMDLYTISIVHDLEGDGIPDIVAAHLEEREESKAGHIKVISGKSGKVIRTIPTPLREEMFVPVQVIVKEDGTELLLITTGGQNTPGGVYTIRLLTLMQYTSEKQFSPFYQNSKSGIMVPAVITDITGDQIPDIIIASFNGTVFAFDGVNATQLWNYTFPASESVSAIVPGHFNHDDIPDFMVKYQSGPGFPVYYYSQTTILNGKTGKSLLDKMMTDSGGSNSLLGGVSISQSFGGDFFLHWQMQCRYKYDTKDAFEFVPDSDIILQSRADTCRLRYNTSSVLKLYAIARHIEPPGAVIFSTDDLEVHLNRTKISQQTHYLSKSPLKHPKLFKKLLNNRDKLLKKVAAAENIEKSSLLNHHQNHFKSSGLRNSLTEPQAVPVELHNNEEINMNQYADLKAKNFQEFVDGESNVKDVTDRKFVGGLTAMRELQKDYDADGTLLHVPEEYDAYNENEVVPQIYQSEARPIRLRAKYPGNRDVRSDIATFGEDDVNKSHSYPTGGVQKNILENKEPLSLWDLEVEKEEQDAFKETHNMDELNNQTANVAQQKRRRRQIHDAATQAIPFDTEADSTNAGEPDEWFLASISSTGVLLQSLNKTKSSIDFAFVLNIRESETYPPLFLPQDLNCVEEKISAYKSYTTENQRILYKQIVKQCLAERLALNAPYMPKYESQIVVARISISCTCRALEANEICSELDQIESQLWTEFMGNNANGFYPHN